MRVVCLSDTHNWNENIEVPNGDMLIHAGDATINGTRPEIEEFLSWYSALPHRHKIFVAGNHDRLFETQNSLARSITADFGISYLQDSFVKIDGMKIYGSPWQPRFFDWAFNLNRGEEMAKKWKLIPLDTDILITHGPPYGILDAVERVEGIERTGCEQLRTTIEKLMRSGRLKLHIFGHIHSGYGQFEESGVRFVNASNCDEMYTPSQTPISIDI